ncbi:hypothetical protein K438DRAFT_1940937 [Mycena galopus ATCC 62051]|nr:hypothetical protein K438DRAFT_1940937 [Mycena galopus ATCC 62051]
MDAHAVAASSLLLLNAARCHQRMIDQGENGFYFPQIEHGDVWILKGGDRRPQDRIKWHSRVRCRPIGKIEITREKQDMLHYADAIERKLMSPTPAGSALIKTIVRFIIDKTKHWVIAYRVDDPTRQSWRIAASQTLPWADIEELPLSPALKEIEQRELCLNRANARNSMQSRRTDTPYCAHVRSSRHTQRGRDEMHTSALNLVDQVGCERTRIGIDGWSGATASSQIQQYRDHQLQTQANDEEEATTSYRRIFPVTSQPDCQLATRTEYQAGVYAMSAHTVGPAEWNQLEESSWFHTRAQPTSEVEGSNYVYAAPMEQAGVCWDDTTSWDVGAGEPSWAHPMLEHVPENWVGSAALGESRWVGPGFTGFMNPNETLDTWGNGEPNYCPSGWSEETNVRDIRVSARELQRHFKRDSLSTENLKPDCQFMGWLKLAT